MRLNLSCLKISIRDLLQCAFNLSKTEVAVLILLLKSSTWASVGDISAGVGRDRSMVQRSLSVLMGRGVVIREQNNLVNGGFQYVYMAANKQKIKLMLFDKSRQFASMVKTTVEKW